MKNDKITKLEQKLLKDKKLKSRNIIFKKDKT